MALPRSPDVVTVSRQQDKLALWLSVFTAVTFVAASLLGAVVWRSVSDASTRWQEAIVACQDTVARGRAYNAMIQGLIEALQEDQVMPITAKDDAIHAYQQGLVRIPDCSLLDH